MTPRLSALLHVVSLAATLAFPFAAPASADVLTIGADRDNTLYEFDMGEKSNGTGRYLFAGVTKMFFIRRGLVRFDIAGAIPAGSTITGLELRMHCSKSSGSGLEVVGLHRVLADWGEGASDAFGEEGFGDDPAPGDVTWFNRFYPGDPWTSPGGDFATTPSATTVVGGIGPKTWNGTALLGADVQGWLDDPATNFGWVLISDESGDDSAKRFNTRENEDPATHPMLTITFDPPPCPPAQAAAETVRLGAPPNPDAFRPGLTGGPVVGTTWQPFIDHSAFQPTAVLDFVGVGASPSNLPSPFGTLLCGAAPALVVTGPPGAPFALPIADDCAFLGVALCAQAGSVEATGAIELANALDLTLGSF